MTGCGIKSAEQLVTHRTNCDGKIILLCMERKKQQNEARRKDTGPERKESIKARLEDIQKELKELRKEVRLCDDILVRSVQIREALRKIESQKRERGGFCRPVVIERTI